MTILILLLLLQLGEEVGEMGEALILWIRHCSEHFSKIMSFHVILTTQLLPSALYKGSVVYPSSWPLVMQLADKSNSRVPTFNRYNTHGHIAESWDGLWQVYLRCQIITCVIRYSSRKTFRILHTGFALSYLSLFKQKKN